MSTEFSTISAQQLNALKDRGQNVAILDVRSVAEYRAGHIPGAQLIPLDSLSAGALGGTFRRPTPGREDTLYITCHSGTRALRAAERLRRAGLEKLTLIEGGTRRWQELGLPLERCGNALSLERQVQIAIGSLLVLKVALGFSVHELFFALTVIPGIGLIVAGATRWCGMASLIGRLPWNRNTDCASTAGA